MSRGLDRKVRGLERRADAKVEAEVAAIWERYGYDADEFMKHASEYEKKRIIDWGWPKIKEEFKLYWDVFMPTVLSSFLEDVIYPMILRPDPRDEDQNTQLLIDDLYLEIRYPELFREFKAEPCPDPDVDPEGFAKWRVSEGLLSKFVKAKMERENMKDRVREELRLEEEKDGREVAEDLGENYEAWTEEDHRSKMPARLRQALVRDMLTGGFYESVKGVGVRSIFLNDEYFRELESKEEK